MKEITVRACAKINLSLDIKGVREDGYHLMEMVMQSVGLADVIRLKKTLKGVSLTVQQDAPQPSAIPRGEGNTAVRAAQLFFEKTGLPGGCQIKLEKHIPSQAGMGGGSADAAGVLAGLDRLYGTGLPKEALLEMGLAVGADVPFCLTGGTALVTGIGEKVEPLPPWKNGRIVIIKPSFGISTAAAFKRYDKQGASKRPDTAALVQALARGDLAAMGAAMGNVMAEGLPEIEALREKLLATGAAGALMTGSGSAVYGIFASELEALSAMGRRLSEGKAYLTAPVPCGVFFEG